jgi:L-fuconolactonase
MTTNSTRRRFLQDTAAVACTAALFPSASALAPPSFPIFDAHIHLFDPSRPGGVPWPQASDTVLYHPALPTRYAALAKPQGVLAAIAIECSPLASDNDWLLQTAATNDLIVGVIGDLDPAQADFPTHLDRLAANPLFRGIRYGNLWNRDLGQHLDNASFIDNLQRLAHHALVLESANPTPQLISDLLRLSTKIPDLRIVIDHLPQATPPADPSARTRYLGTLKQLSERPNIFVKGSEIFRSIDGHIPLTLASYTPWLNTLWQLFGEDRLFFGSDWPNSDHLTPFADVFALARSYLATRSSTANRKFFWTNSIAVYGWRPRTKEQRRA